MNTIITADEEINIREKYTADEQGNERNLLERNGNMGRRK